MRLKGGVSQQAFYFSGMSVIKHCDAGTPPFHVMWSIDMWLACARLGSIMLELRMLDRHADSCHPPANRGGDVTAWTKRHVYILYMDGMMVRWHVPE